MYRQDNIVVPPCCTEVESKIQHVLYVENRMQILSTLKHDKLNLKNELLQTLTPPDVIQGFSSRISELRKELTYAENEIEVLTSRLETARKCCTVVNSNHIETVRSNAQASTLEKSAGSSSSPGPKGSNFGCFAVIAIVLLLIGYGIGVTLRGPVDQAPLVPNTPKGGTVNDNESYQPQQGPNAQSSHQRRL